MSRHGVSHLLPTDLHEPQERLLRARSVLYLAWNTFTTRQTPVTQELLDAASCLEQEALAAYETQAASPTNGQQRGDT